MPQRFAFVATDDSAKISSSERQLIRHHCMRQRNKKPGSRRSKRENARAAAEFSPKFEKQDPNSSSGVKLIPPEDRVESRPESSTREGRMQVSHRKYIMPSPPSDWALFQFPDELDVFSQKLMHQYFLHNPIRDALYPFKHFGLPVDFDEDPLWCFRLLCSEQLCFRAILLLTSASDDLILRRPMSNNTYRHLRRTLPILNNRLSSTDAHEHDIILYVIGILASIAILFGEYNAAKIHSRGLSDIIRLRGGFKAINSNPVIQFSIDRLNFSSLLVTKLWTPIYDSSIWKAPIFPAEIMSLYRSQGMLRVDGLVESDLAAVFHSLQYTTIVLNKHYYDKTPIDGIFVQQCLGFVHSNLAKLQGQLKNEISECLRLGMMAFLATTFRLPEMYEQHYCKNLAHELQLSYVTAKASTPHLQKTIDIWLTLVLLISTDYTNQPYSWASWEATAANESAWSETRRQLKQVMWIDTFHDDLGRRAFKALTTRTGAA